MYQIRIEFTFDSGHRLLDYNGKCAYPHGHTYRTEVFIESQSLNDLGLVYDFTDLKDKIKTKRLVNQRTSTCPAMGSACSQAAWIRPP
jgi:6-pyruvoyl-tetrahydropterin synthase